MKPSRGTASPHLALSREVQRGEVQLQASSFPGTGPPPCPTYPRLGWEPPAEPGFAELAPWSNATLQFPTESCCSLHCHYSKSPFLQSTAGALRVIQSKKSTLRTCPSPSSNNVIPSFHRYFTARPGRQGTHCSFRVSEQRNCHPKSRPEKPSQRFSVHFQISPQHQDRQPSQPDKPHIKI